MAQPGGGHTAAQPSGTQPVSQPGAGPASQPAAQPGTGYPAQPGAGQPGATSFISVKGILIAAAAIVAIVIAIAAAFFLLRPNPPQQTAAQQSPTTANTLPPGAAPPPGGPPGAASDGPLLRGTYNEHGELRTPGAPDYSADYAVKFSSDCPACDATYTGPGGALVFHWNGTGWTNTKDGGACGSVTITLTPTAVVDGMVQAASGGFTACESVDTKTWTRTGG
jgi:hypothetical protein